MARVNGDAGLRPERLRPQASPVGYFTNPQAGAELDQLAQGLSGLAPHLAQFSEVYADRRNKEQQMQGEEAARKAQESGKTYAQAIKDGTIRPDQSPWFRLGAEETFGRNAAHKYAADLQVAFAQSDAASSNDPSDFDKFEQQFRKKWVADNVGDKTTTPYFQRAFGNQSESLVDGMRQNFAEAAGANLVKAAGEGVHAEIFQAVLDGGAAGQSADQIAASINLARQRAIASGMNRSLVNQMTANAITAAATRSNNANLLDVMDKVQLGSGKLSGTTYGSALREQAENEIADVSQRRMVAQREQAASDKKKGEDGVYGDLAAALTNANDPHSVDLKPFLNRMTAISPDKADTLLKMRDAWTDSSFSDEPELVSHTFADIYTKSPGDPGYVDTDYVSRLLAEKHITQQTFRSMISELQTRDREGGGAGKLFNDPNYKEGSRRIRNLFVAEFGFDTQENRWRADAANTEFTNDYFRWRQGAGASATALDLNTFFDAEGQKLLRTKSDASTAKDANRLPKGNTGPTVPDWKKMLVADPSYIRQIKSERTEQLSKKRKGLSSTSVELLNQLHVAPKDLDAFLAAQEKLSPLPVTNP